MLIFSEPNDRYFTDHHLTGINETNTFLKFFNYNYLSTLSIVIRNRNWPCLKHFELSVRQVKTEHIKAYRVNIWLKYRQLKVSLASRDIDLLHSNQMVSRSFQIWHHNKSYSHPMSVMYSSPKFKDKFHLENHVIKWILLVHFEADVVTIWKCLTVFHSCEIFYFYHFFLSTPLHPKMNTPNNQEFKLLSCWSSNIL